MSHVARAILGLCLDHNCKSHVTIVTNHKTRSNKVKHGVKVDTDDSNVNIIGHLVFDPANQDTQTPKPSFLLLLQTSFCFKQVLVVFM